MQATCTQEPYIVGTADRRSHGAPSPVGNNGSVFSYIRRQREAKISSSSPQLRHVVVAGGELDDWESMSADQWSGRVGVLATVAAAHGARWVTVFPFGSRPAPACQMTATSYDVAGVRVLVSPQADGRRRIAETLRVASDVGFDEDSVEQLLHGEAGEPDLVVVLGSDDRLPPSLVWELAYSELVFLPVEWAVLDGERLDDALGVYFGRERRFGGVDE